MLSFTLIFIGALVLYTVLTGRTNALIVALATGTALPVGPKT